MTYVSPHILILDLSTDEVMLDTSPSDPTPTDEKVNVTFLPVINTDYDEKVEIEL